jgi:endonuclease/exonuclease/phosphatase (EEP) superfamily protein YafD
MAHTSVTRTPGPPPRGLARGLGRLAAVAVALTLVASALALSARYGWLGDLAVNFRLQLAALAASALILLAAMRRWGWTAAAAVAVIMQLPAVRAVLPARQPASASAPATPMLRVVSINVFFGSSHYEDVRQFLQAARPDIAVLEEVTPPWRAALSPLKQLPYQFYAAALRPRLAGAQPRGVLLLSRWPLTDRHSLDLGPGTEPAVSARIGFAGRELYFLGVHATWPLGPGDSRERNGQLELLARLAHAATDPCIVAGDFNLTPFSPHYAEFLALSALHAASRGWQPTWPTFLPPAGIQIDHVFVSASLTVREFRRGPRVGSDHWPILADLELAAQPRSSTKRVP